MLPFYLRTGEYRSLLVKPGEQALSLFFAELQGETVLDICKVLAKKTDYKLVGFETQFTLLLKTGADTTYQKAPEKELEHQEVILDLLAKERGYHPNQALSFIFGLRSDRARLKQTHRSMKIRNIDEAKKLDFGSLKKGEHGAHLSFIRDLDQNDSMSNERSNSKPLPAQPLQSPPPQPSTKQSSPEKADAGQAGARVSKKITLPERAEKVRVSGRRNQEYVSADEIDGDESDVPAMPTAPLPKIEKPAGNRVTISPNLANVQLADEIRTLVGYVKELRVVVAVDEPDPEAFMNTFKRLFEHVRIIQNRVSEEKKQKVVALTRPVLEKALQTKSALTNESGTLLINELAVYLKNLGEALREDE